MRKVLLSAVALAMFTAPLAAQTGHPMLRLDRSTSAADPDDTPEVTIVHSDVGFQVNTGPAAVVWQPENTVSGAYTLRGTFRLLEPSDHVNYYGLVYGGRDLEGASQNYLYFLVAQNGSYIIKHRANDETTHDIVGRTEHSAVNVPDAAGTSVNDLEVRVGTDTVDFVINDEVVHSMANSGMAGRTDGIYGVRVNHRIPGVVVENLEVIQ